MLPPVIRGSVTDRPWGATLGRLLANRQTGELVVIADGKRYAVAFNAGGVVGAYAPGAADSVGRIALTSHLVSSTQVAEITRRIAAHPERDEIEVIAETARLSPTQADTLRRRVITQRAARTFALEQGAFAFDDKVRTVELRGGAIDTRAVIYLGARMHVAEPRLANELRTLGNRFVLLLEAIDDLPKFGFDASAKPILDALRRGTTVAELELSHRELDPRMIAACVYTLACCAAIGEAPGGRGTGEQPAIGRVNSPMRLVNQRATTEQPVVSRTVTPQPVVSRTMTPPPAVSRTMTPNPERPRISTEQSAPISIPRTMTPQPAVARTQTPVPPLAQGSSPAVKSVTIPPVAIARTATPPAGTAPPPPRTTTNDLDARDAFQRGEMAMRREQLGEAIGAFMRAVELMPDHSEYIATLAWAKFCAAIDKSSVADDTRKQLKKAMSHDHDSVTARMCLGRVERMLGREREALDYFRQVLELQPRHSAAASEARVLESRIK